MPALAYDAWLARAAKLKGSDIGADGKAIMRALVELTDEAQAVDQYADDVALIPIDDADSERVTRLDACGDCKQTDTGQTGEYPCVTCDLPTTHDAATTKPPQ